MNSFQSENESVQPTYMSQAEANEVMELWTRRQREDASRQAMVTIHDVAEATQLSPQEIQQLLRDVRSSKTVQRAEPARMIERGEPDLWPALVKVGPYSILPALLLIIVCVAQRNPFSVAGWVVLLCCFWIFAITVSYSIYGVIRLTLDARRGRASRQINSPPDRGRNLDR